MRTILGLGNPGARYRRTRHNAGFLFLDGIVSGRFLPEASIGSRDRAWATDGSTRMGGKAPFVMAEARIGKEPVALVKPVTYMNESGRAVASLRTRGIIRDFAELLVIIDDVDLDIGRLRYRRSGSAGGHNGLKSIIEHVGTMEFARLRIGVGPRPGGDEMVDYVLGVFRPGEYEAFEQTLEHAGDVVMAWLAGDDQGASTRASRINTTTNHQGDHL